MGFNRIIIHIYHTIMGSRSGYFSLILILALIPMSSCWAPNSDMVTGQVVILTGATYSAMSIPISYNITYSNGAALTQTVSCGLGIVGFSSYITNYFSINATIVNFLTTTMRVTAQIFDDTLVNYFSVNYIGLGLNIYFAQVQFSCFLPVVLSAGNGTRYQYKNGMSIFNGKILQTKVMLSGFRLLNANGMNNQLLASVSSPANTSYLNWTFQTTDNNTVLSICYTTVIFCENLTQVLYYDWGATGTQQTSNTVPPSSTPINGIYYRANEMFFGMGGFNLSRTVNRLWNVDTTSYSNIGAGYQSNSGTYGVTLNYFMDSVRGCNITNNQWFEVPTMSCVNDNSCMNGTTQTLPSSARFCAACDYTCNTCNGSLYTNCSTCDNYTYRVKVGTTCPCVNASYIDIGQKLCYPCQYFIAGCNTCTTTSVCSTCLAGFIMTPGATCQCTAGFLVTGVCTTISGCTSAIQLGGTVYCQSCNLTLFFVNINFTCVCDTGFTLSSNLSTCSAVCGDGLVVTGEGCDDANLVDGDGCSSTCAVQANWTCINAPNPSKCYLINGVTAKVVFVRRLLDSNTAYIGIEIWPKITNFSAFNWKKYVTTDMPCQPLSADYSNNILNVYCPYPYTIQGKDYTMNLQMDPTYFSNVSVSLAIPADGMNAKLTYDSTNGANLPLNILVYILDALAIIVLFCGCLSERMIGVEMIQVLQSVGFGMAVMMSTTPSQLSSLQQLTYSNGFNQLAKVDYARTYTLNFPINQVGIEKEFLLSANLTPLIVLVVILTCILLKVILVYQLRQVRLHNPPHARQLAMQQKYPNHFKIRAVYNFIFQRILFLLGLGAMFLILFATASEIDHRSSYYVLIPRQFNLLCCVVAAAVVITLIAMVIINGIFPLTMIFPMFMNRAYPPYYVMYQSAWILCTAFIYPRGYAVYILMILTGLNFIVLAIWRPYPQRIHNMALLFHQAVIMLALGTYLYEEMHPTAHSEQIYLIACIVIIVLLYAVVFLAIYRLCRFYQWMNKKGLTYEQPYNMKEEEQAEENYNSINSGKSMETDSVEMKQVSKTPSGPPPKAFQNSQTSPYHRELKEQSMRVPLNSNTPNSSKRDPMTRRINFDDSRQNMYTNNDKPKTDLNRSYMPAEDPNKDGQFDTFNQNNKTQQSRVANPNDYVLEPRDEIPTRNNTPYDQYGTPEHSYNRSEEEYDALKIIKERLRRDFYSKVHGTEYVEHQDDTPAQNKIAQKHVEEEEYEDEDPYEE